MTPRMHDMIPPEAGDELHAWRIPNMVCPNCGYTIDGMSVAPNGSGRTTPLDGDMSICFGCTELLVIVSFAGKIGVRVATAAEGSEFRQANGDVGAYLRLLKIYKPRSRP